MWNAVLDAGKKHNLWLLLLLTIEEFKLEFFLGVKIWIKQHNPFSVI
jgi:hypothetical protein